MPGLLRGVARVGVAAGTATAVSNRVSRRQARRWGEQDAAAAPAEQYEQQAPPPPPSADDPRIVQLQQLAEVKGEGVLSDEKFATQKARILACPRLLLRRIRGPEQLLRVEAVSRAYGSF